MRFWAYAGDSHYRLAAANMNYERLFQILFGLGFALITFVPPYLELALLRRSFQFAGLALIPLVLVHLVFLIILTFTLAFPLFSPVVLVVHFFSKWVAYQAVRWLTGGPLHSPWKVLFGSLFLEYAVFISAFIWMIHDVQRGFDADHQ